MLCKWVYNKRKLPNRYEQKTTKLKKYILLGNMYIYLIILGRNKVMNYLYFG